MARLISKPRGGYKSTLEFATAQVLEKHFPGFRYEPEEFTYVLKCKYTPDFLLSNGIFVETKGYLDATSRRVILGALRDNPDLSRRYLLCFQNANNRISKGSKTTYGAWATKNGITWCSTNNLIVTLRDMSPA